MAALYQAQEKYQEAETYHLKALKIREKELGLEHPDTAQSYWWVAILYELRADYKKAEEFYLKTINIFEDKLGVEHPRTINVKQYLTDMLKKIDG